MLSPSLVVPDIPVPVVPGMSTAAAEAAPVAVTDDPDVEGAASSLPLPDRCAAESPGSWSAAEVAGACSQSDD